MIKAVDVIPESFRARPKTQLELIEDDIREAINTGIETFEFIDERYNYMNLANYARQPICKLTRQAIQAKFDEYMKDKNCVISFSSLGGIGLKRDFNAYIRVQRMTDENGNPHVYGHISSDGLKFIWEKYYLPRVKELLKAKQNWAQKYGNKTAC